MVVHCYTVYHRLLEGAGNGVAVPLDHDDDDDDKIAYFTVR